MKREKETLKKDLKEQERKLAYYQYRYKKLWQRGQRFQLKTESQIKDCEKDIDLTKRLLDLID